LNHLANAERLPISPQGDARDVQLTKLNSPLLDSGIPLVSLFIARCHERDSLTGGRQLKVALYHLRSSCLATGDAQHMPAVIEFSGDGNRVVL
jgi:hypothetical protein